MPGRLQWQAWFWSPCLLSALPRPGDQEAASVLSVLVSDLRYVSACIGG
jgi:hypothetical protein